MRHVLGSIAALLTIRLGLGSAGAQDCLHYEQFLRLTGEWFGQEGGEAISIDIHKGHVFLGCNRQHALIFDLDAPGYLCPIGTLPGVPGADHRQMAREGSTLAAGGYDGILELFDVSNPAAPQRVGQRVLLERITGLHMEDGIVFDGDFAWMTDYPGRLKRVDLSDPSAPLVASERRLPGTLAGVALDGHRLAVASGAIDEDTYIPLLSVLDATYTDSPDWLAQLNFPGLAQAIATVGETAYVAAGLDGLFVFNDRQGKRAFARALKHHI